MKQKFIPNSQKGIIQRVNPEFIGIAKTVENSKRERKDIEKEKQELDQ